MTDEDKYKGTGNLIAEIGPLRLYDDGDNDSYIEYRFMHNGQEKSWSFKQFRREVGDEEFKRLLEQGGQSGTNVSSSDFEIREPVAYKCQGCNRTFPRTMKGDNGKCPDCS